MKYIITFDDEVFIFPDDPDKLSHKEVAGALNLKPKSAGHVGMDEDGDIYIEGYSDTLNLMPGPGDEQIISAALIDDEF